MILDELKAGGREEQHGFLNLGTSHVTMVYGHIQMDAPPSPVTLAWETKTKQHDVKNKTEKAICKHTT